MAVSYRIVFDGFDSDTVARFEEYLPLFAGYRSHRPSELMERRHAYQYKSTIGSARLLRNLMEMLKQTGRGGRVHFSGNTYTLYRI